MYPAMTSISLATGYAEYTEEGYLLAMSSRLKYWSEFIKI